MSIHHLKINKQPFDDLVSGRKTGEVRDCSDRDFKVGDSVELFMTETETGLATESIVRNITHIQLGYGLPDNICVLSYAAPVIENKGESVAFLTIAERIRAATIADSAQEGVNIAEGRFGSAMASLCRELDVLHQGEPVAVLYADGSVLTKAECGISFDICCKVETPLYRHPAEQSAPLAVDAAKAFAKGFNTLEQAGGKYRINMQFANRDDAWAAYGALGKLSNTLNTK